MEYIARIAQEYKLRDLWKYEFLDVQTKQTGCFYNDKQISYNPNITGKLNLTKENFFQSFEQEINNLVGGVEEINNLVKYEEKTKKIFERVKKRLPKRQIEVSIQKLHELHNQGYTWKEVGAIYGKSEPTMYRWIKKDEREPQKRGRKLKIKESTIELLRSYIKTDNAKTLQEMSDYLLQETAKLFRIPTIFRVLRKHGISWKKATKQYFELDKERFKKFG
jgi:transposase